MGYFEIEVCPSVLSAEDMFWLRRIAEESIPEHAGRFAEWLRGVVDREQARRDVGGAPAKAIIDLSQWTGKNLGNALLAAWAGVVGFSPEPDEPPELLGALAFMKAVMGLLVPIVKKELAGEKWR